MSVFRVAVNNKAQGVLDTDPSSGAQKVPSIQRTIYVAGPNRRVRELKDGTTFTDSNYWKKFAFPQCSLENQIVEVISDDGSIWSDIDSENTFPKVYTLSVLAATTYVDNVANILSDTGGYAVYAQIANGGAGSVMVKINGLSSAIFELAGGDTQIFNNGDLTITQLSFDNSASGATDADVQIICSVKSVSQS